MGYPTEGLCQHASKSEVIRDYLQKELSLGRMLGPFTDTNSLPPFHINRFGVIPKGHNIGKWRLITDLSYPHGHRVKEGIDSTLCSLQYTTVDQMARVVEHLGTGAMLAKVDIESAYRCTLRTARCRQCNSRGIPISTPCCRSVSGQPQRSLTQSPMP